jgi:predicted O-methyltransferase YrrM
MINPTITSLELVREISKSIQTFHHHYHILYDIAAQFYPDGCNYLEIGTFKGASSALMITRPNTNIVTIDTGKYVKKDEVISNISKFNFCNNNFWYFEKDSHKVATRYAIEEFMPLVDILFIDGDHSYSGCKKDIQSWLPKIKQGGWIGGHDYKHPNFNSQVHLAVDELFPNIELDSDYSWFVKVR